MNKFKLLIVLLFTAFSTVQVSAQAFDKSTKLITINLGMGDMIHVPVGSNNPLANLGGGGFGIALPSVNRAVITGQLTFEGEFAVHKYVGVGFAIGLGGRAESVGSLNGLTVNYGYYKEVNIPIALLANFHFYQLIADKKGGNLHADKLDVYAGITAGSGVAIHPYKDNNTGAKNFNDVLAYGGPHAGVNYYFTPKIGINGEVGWGVTVIHAGLVIKL